MKRNIDDRCKVLIYDSSWNANQLFSPYRVADYNWDIICKTVANPVIASTLKGYSNVEDKRSVIPLWSFYIPVESPTKLRKDGKPSGCAENMFALHCLQLDYDSGEVTIKDFISQWKDYAFILYTSPSYKTEHEKFRVIMPLLKGQSPRIFSYKSTKQYMTSEVFEGCDPSTIDSYRKQRMPARMDSNSPYKYYINNVDKCYELPKEQLQSLMNAEDQLNESRMRYSEEHKSDNIEPLILSLKDKMKYAIEGTRNRTYYNSAFCLSQQGMNGGEIYDTLKECVDESMMKEFEDICKRF